MKEIIQQIKESASTLSQILQRGTSTYSDSENSTGDKQLQLDLQMNQALIEVLEAIPSVYGIISEELDEMKIANHDGTYIIAMDPLDGSNVAPIGLSVGTSIGIYTKDQHIPSGNTLVESMYILYGSRLTCTYTDGNKVYTTTLLGDEWSTPTLLSPLPAKASHMAPGAWMDYEERHHLWSTIESYINTHRPKPRYMGSLTADIHLILRQSGVFLYPTPKLRLLYEVLPLGHMVELLGGKASTWDGVPVKEVVVESIHQIAGCIMGCSETVAELLPPHAN